MKFFFPKIFQDFQRVNSSDSLSKTIEQHLYQNGINKMTVSFLISMKKQRYLYAKCSHKGCPAQMRFKKDLNNNFLLNRWINEHHHTNTSYRKYKTQALCHYIQQFPLQIDNKSIKNIVKRQFSLNDRQIYYLLSKTRNKEPLLDDLVKNLEDKNFEIYLSDEQRQNQSLPELFIAVSKQMKANFIKYGYVTSFDLTFNMIKDVHHSEQKWKLGLFVGFNENKRIIPFGLVVTLYGTTEVYSHIFRTFFNVVGVPKVIITDQQKAIGAALTKLQKEGQFEGHHLLDIFHILRNLRNRIKQKHHIRLFQQIIFAKNVQQFNRCVEKAKRKLSQSEDKRYLANFLERSYLYCFSQLPSQFFGFSSSSSPNESLHSRLKTIFNSEKPFTAVVSNVLRYCQRLQVNSRNFQMETVKYEQIFKVSHLKTIRYLISKPVFAHFLEQFCKSIQCQVVEERQSLIYIRQINSYFELRINEQLWECSCKYRLKSGLPCRHMIRYLVIKDLNFVDYIDNRWRRNCQVQADQQLKSNTISSFKSLGRPKSSKRKIFI